MAATTNRKDTLVAALQAHIGETMLLIDSIKKKDNPETFTNRWLEWLQSFTKVVSIKV